MQVTLAVTSLLNEMANLRDRNENMHEHSSLGTSALRIPLVNQVEASLSIR
jgi:hypothetical protein